MPFTNRYQTRAEWADCDPLGQMFYPNYDRLIDARNIAGLPLVDAQASFQGRCRWTDDVEIESFISRFGGKSFTVTHNVWNDGEIAVEGTEIRIWGLFDPEDDTKLKAGVIPDDFKKTFG